MGAREDARKVALELCARDVAPLRHPESRYVTFATRAGVADPVGRGAGGVAETITQFGRNET